MELLAGAAARRRWCGCAGCSGAASSCRSRAWPTTRPPPSSTAAAEPGGETVRSLIDCLIAVVAMRHGAALLHRDHDFDVLARHTPLQDEVAGTSR